MVCEEWFSYPGKDIGDGCEWHNGCKLDWTGETCPYTEEMCPLKEEYAEKHGWLPDE